MITITITMDETTGQLNVNGPIDQPIIAYGMLERARDAIKDHNDDKRDGKNGIIKPVLAPILVPKGRG